jgi:DNA-binding LytR/AlgR family response regulator
MTTAAPEEPVPARALIVDDEAPARAELRHQLAAFHDVVVVGEATTAEEAEVLIASVGYDLVFLDIRMPGIGGIELGRQLSGTGDQPAVVFTTAFPDHAVEAFELGATDYLVKPFDEERLRRAIDRALAESSPRARADDGPDSDGPAEPAGRSRAGEQRADDDRDARASGSEGPVRIPVHKGDRIVLIEAPRIAFAEAARGYAYLTLVTLPQGHPLAGADRLLSSHTLADLEERLSDDFLRTHRSFLVNVRLVREVVRQVGGGMSLVMGDRNRTLVPVARRQAAEVRQRLGV